MMREISASEDSEGEVWDFPHEPWGLGVDGDTSSYQRPH